MCQQTEVNLLGLFIPSRDRFIVLLSSMPSHEKKMNGKVLQKVLVCHASHLEKSRAGEGVLYP